MGYHLWRAMEVEPTSLRAVCLSLPLREEGGKVAQELQDHSLQAVQSAEY